jgi:sugar phosphate isomerase/epimerase
MAWEVEEDQAVSLLLNRLAISYIDVVPGKYFSNPALVEDKKIKEVKKWWSERGITIYGMQSLLFGTSGLNVFAVKEVQDRMLTHLSSIFRIANQLDAKALVFGSPKNRDRSGLSDQDVNSVAAHFFNRLGDLAKEWGVVVCLEPNPHCYGANFMTTLQETITVVELVNHPAIKVQIDTGALKINNESLSDFIVDKVKLVGHVHISEPNLVPVGQGGVDHQKISGEIVKYLPNSILAVEMLATKEEAHLVAIERALHKTIEFYR